MGPPESGPPDWGRPVLPTGHSGMALHPPPPTWLPSGGSTHITFLVCPPTHCSSLPVSNTTFDPFCAEIPNVPNACTEPSDPLIVWLCGGPGEELGLHVIYSPRDFTAFSSRFA